MEKQKIQIEKNLKCKSASIIWNLISTAEGLSKWIADDVKRDGNVLEFGWGVPWRHHETRTARVMEELQPSCFVWSWDDEGDDYPVEIRLSKSDITNDFIMQITDYAESDDKDWLEAVWDSNFERLHATTGL